jgi:acyl-CoA-binding protein
LILNLWVIYTRQAWQKLGAMPPEDAMQKYIDIITELYPTWASGSAMVRFSLLI